MDAVIGLAGHAVRRPGGLAVLSGDRHLSHAELVRRVESLAGRLAGHGLAPGDVVGLSVEDELAHLLTVLALLRLGVHQVALATFDPAALRVGLARQCGVGAIVADRDDMGLPGLKLVLPDFEASLSKMPAPSALPPNDPDAETLLLASSGTTGRPKIVPMSQRQLLARAPRFWRHPDAEESFTPTSIQFNAAKRQVLVALAVGKTARLAASGERRALAERCLEGPPGTLWLSAMQARSLVDALAAVQNDGPALPPATRIVLGGSSVSEGLRDDIMRVLGSELEVGYGSTETGRVSRADAKMLRAGDAGVGRPAPGVEVGIVDGDGRPLPPGEAGEIRIRSPGMATGYFRDPELTQRAFRGGWYHSGDIGLLRPDGVLAVEGRRDDMMALNSVKVFPAEIERVFETQPGIVECAAFSRRSPVHGDIPMLAVVAAGEVDIGALLALGRARLGMRAPRRIVRVPRLPRNGSGKIVRTALAGLVVE